MICAVSDFQRVKLAACVLELNPSCVRQACTPTGHDLRLEACSVCRMLPADAEGKLFRCVCEMVCFQPDEGCLCRVSDTCVYNVPNFASAAIVSMVTQQTIGEPHFPRYNAQEMFGARLGAIISRLLSMLCPGEPFPSTRAGNKVVHASFT